MAIVADFKDKIRTKEIIFLPMATIIETGNHIAQNGDGRQRRARASQFVGMLEKAAIGQAPFKFLNFLTSEALEKWLPEFIENATHGTGFGDLSIIKDWENQKILHPRRKVYIWSLDRHLQGYSTK